ncbi:MAG: hypothetical protein ACREBN_00665 [Burkholderiaceae bacterium]
MVAAIVVATTTAVAVGGFSLARRHLQPRIKYHDGVNDVISGALGAIGVLYGITVGLITIDVWQRHTTAEDLVVREAAAIQVLYTMVSADIGSKRAAEPLDQVPKPEEGDSVKVRKPVAELVARYLRDVICVAWVEQKAGKKASADGRALRAIRQQVLSIEPDVGGQQARYAAAIQSLNQLNELRRLRADAATGRLSGVMWMIIVLGALMSMCLVYLFRLEDSRLHLLVVSVLSGFLGLVFLMIVLNDRPFFGSNGIEPDTYTELGWMIKRPNPFGSRAQAAKGEERPEWQEVCKTLTVQ